MGETSFQLVDVGKHTPEEKIKMLGAHAFGSTWCLNLELVIHHNFFCALFAAVRLQQTTKVKWGNTSHTSRRLYRANS